MSRVTMPLLFVALLCVAEPAFADDSVNIVVLAPKILYSGGTASVTITTVSAVDQTPANVPVRGSLRPTDSGTAINLFQVVTGSDGHVSVSWRVPDVEPGVYALVVQSSTVGVPLEADVEVRTMPVVLIETDKPIYKPGQTIHGRVLLLTNELRPAATEVEVDITDGKGVRIFREELTSNAFGVAPFELDLATELNFGTWKISAKSGSASSSVDVRVEKYVLPRFDVGVSTGRDYFLVDEEILGTVSADYFFGKPVDGTVQVVASRYVGVWEEYAVYTGALSDGTVDFELPATGYVSGTAGAGGAGSATLDITVTDTSGHEEKTTKLLKIVESPIQIQLIAASPVITPGLPFEVLVVAETPDGEPVDVDADVTAQFLDGSWSTLSEQHEVVTTSGGIAQVSFDTPEDAVEATIGCLVSEGGRTSDAWLTIYAAYSPTSSFLHLRRASAEPIQVGDTVVIDVFKTNDATVYCDLFASGRTLVSSATRDAQIVFQATHHMVPVAKVIAYVINPNNEISADTLPFDVSMDDAAGLEAWFDVDETMPGEPVQVALQADTEAMVGISIVDESVYALNEGRLNLQQVFNELERRFMQPQAEAHPHMGTYGAYDVFEDAGVQVLASTGFDIPEGTDFSWRGGGGIWMDVDMDGAPEFGGAVPAPSSGQNEVDDGLAEVTRVRQFFPETWLWTPDLLTETDGTATIDLTAPDSITTWRLHAVSTSENGLGIAETQLPVFQEFFGEPDLPYAVTRGEQFPVRVQIFNYLETPQNVQVDLTDDDWFDLLESNTQTVSIGANSVGSAMFLIQPTVLGNNIVEVTLRSPERADAVRKELLVEPEGTRREAVTNGVLHAGDLLTLDTSMPPYMVPDSGKVLLSVTPSLVAQTISGVGDLLGMPYGCGEQNMIFFAPDVEVLRYLDATDQLMPEVQAEAEHYITVGYQRQLTFRHADGAFSAFGESDETGSLWLTAFVLGTFSGARDVHTIDETVLSEAADWVESYQLADGSWEPVGFICHTEMVGGMEGTYALTAFVTIALAEYGAASAGVLQDATDYLAGNLSSVNDDAYALAIAALAFARLDASAASTAIDRLLELAIVDETGTHWEPFDIETTAYAALALMQEQMPQANDAIKWIAAQRNSLGGFNSTQDTVMALKALMTAAMLQRRDVNLIVTATEADPENPGEGNVLAQFSVDSTNFDVLQVAELPLGSSIDLVASGSGEVNFQLVRRFNVLLSDQIICNDMQLDVEYDAQHVSVDDIVNVTVRVSYIGPGASSGMLLVDVGVPTGFAPVQETLDALVSGGSVSRIEVAGRKVILYIDDLPRETELTLPFQVKALFPVRAIIPDSKAYMYYKPEVRAEKKGAEISVDLFDPDADYDGDGLPNGWEEEHGLDLNDPDGDNGPAGDGDGDGLSNLQEMGAGTRPDSADSDGDFAQDGWEFQAGTDPTNVDDVPARVRGDINGDGVANAIDVQKTINQALGMPPADCDILADSNGDERVDATDIQSVINTALEI